MIVSNRQHSSSTLFRFSKLGGKLVDQSHLEAAVWRDSGNRVAGAKCLIHYRTIMHMPALDAAATCPQKANRERRTQMTLANLN